MNNNKELTTSFSIKQQLIINHINVGIKILKEQRYTKSLKENILRGMSVSKSMIQSSKTEGDLESGLFVYGLLTKYLEDNHNRLLL